MISTVMFEIRIARDAFSLILITLGKQVYFRYAHRTIRCHISIHFTHKEIRGHVISYVIMQRHPYNISETRNDLYFDIVVFFNYKTS